MSIAVSSSRWIEVGALARAFDADSHVLPPSDLLAGRKFTLCLGDDAPVQLEILPAGRVRYGRGPAAREYPARITSLRADIYLIDHPAQPLAHSTSLIVDLHRGRALSVSARLPKRTDALRSLRQRFEANEPLTSVSADVRTGFIGTEAAAAPFEPSLDLIGMHNRYVYSPHEIYDHIYLNGESYLWHCIQGIEAGLADVDSCQTYRIDEGLYLFFWCEKIVPTLGLVLIDLAQGRTDGKIIGYRDGGFTVVVSFPVGAKIMPMSRLRGMGGADG